MHQIERVLLQPSPSATEVPSWAETLSTVQRDSDPGYNETYGERVQILFAWIVY